MPKSKRKTARNVRLLKSGNRIVVSPTTPRIRDLVTPYLGFTEKKFLYGEDLRLARAEGRVGKADKIEFIPWDIYTLDLKDRIACPAGFHDIITKVLTKAGYEVTIKDLRPADPELFEPDWDNVQNALGDGELRYRQREFLQLLVDNFCGRFDLPPGFGKSFLAGLAGRLFPRARIGIAARSADIIRGRIYPEISNLLPDVGVFGGGTPKNKNARVLLSTIGSMHHLPGDLDILFCDELQDFAADDAAEQLGRFRQARYFGLSATHDMRSDGKDKRAEAMFGPIIMKMTQQEAVKHDLIVPLKVKWHPVVMDSDPGENADGVKREKLAVWFNDFRNEQIAKAAREFGPDDQVLITCRAIQHVLELKRLLPEYYIVYSHSGMDEEAVEEYMEAGKLPANFKPMTLKRRLGLTKALVEGRAKKAIATPVFNVGVSFPQLAAVIRADAGSSAINDVQIPGRATRLSDGKDFGYVVDFMDQFSTSFRRRAKSRESSYKGMGFEQEFPKRLGDRSLDSKLGLEYDEFSEDFLD